MTLKNSEGRTLTLAELRGELATLKTEGQELLTRSEDADTERMAAVSERLTAVGTEIGTIEANLERMKTVAAESPSQTEAGTPFGSTDYTRQGSSTRDQAMRTLDRATASGELPAHGAETVQKLMQTGSAGSQSFAQRWAIATGSEEYRSAFSKLLSDPDKGHLRWDARESEAYRRVAAIQSEQRGMAESGTAGYMVPLSLDPSILLTSAGSRNPLRQIARVVQTTTNSWTGVSSAGVTAEWSAEAAEMADATPTLGNPVVPVYKGSAFIPYSFEVGQDGLNFLGELQKLLVDGADQLMATAYTTGAGSTQPKGIITALVAAGGSSIVAGAGSEALVAQDAYNLQSALPPRFQADAQWAANLNTLNTFRQFETTNGSLKFPSLQNDPPRLLGRPVNEISNMDGTLNPAATEANYALLVGDFDEFLIVDRIGTTIELVPHLVGANHRPTGQRGALLWFRTGSDVLVPNAFRLLSTPTTA